MLPKSYNYFFLYFYDMVFIKSYEDSIEEISLA